jgi:hypothetical protein
VPAVWGVRSCSGAAARGVARGNSIGIRAAAQAVGVAVRWVLVVASLLWVWRW